MISAEEVVRVYRLLLDDDIQIWLNGGWGLDALLGEQTRPHKDLDVIMLLDDVLRMCELLGGEGYVLKELWSENRPAVDAQGLETATAFVLWDPQGREFDVHAMRFDAQGNGLPMWENSEGLVFKPQDLAGTGSIAGVAVRCFTPEMQMLCHVGYELPEKHARDVELLHERFGVAYPGGGDGGAGAVGSPELGARGGLMDA